MDLVNVARGGGGTEGAETCPTGLINSFVTMKSGWNVNSSLLFSPVEKSDGPWAWIICFVNFGILFCGVGVYFTFGVLYVGLLEYFSNHTNVVQPVNASGNVSETASSVGLASTLGMYR